jgi:hypothetical protein
MSKGHIFLAQNGNVDYVRQACALALSIKKFNTINETCIVTNDVIPKEYEHAFDYVVNIPWTDSAKDSSWKIENRWKIIHASPFKENLVYDTDMLLLNSNDHWWHSFKGKSLSFTTNVVDYNGKIITDDYYRKVFTGNNLPNIYTGCFYFKKDAVAYEFFKWLEVIVKNWTEIYKKHLDVSPQKFLSIDVSAALAYIYMDNTADISINHCVPTFTHMKPAIQGWKNIPSLWSSTIYSSFNNECQLKVGGMMQQGLFHYVEDEFLQEHMLKKLMRK